MTATSASKEYMLLFTLPHRLTPPELSALHNSNGKWKHYTPSYSTRPWATTNIFVFCQQGIYLWITLWKPSLCYSVFVYISIKTSKYLIWLLVTIGKRRKIERERERKCLSPSPPLKCADLHLHHRQMSSMSVSEEMRPSAPGAYVPCFAVTVELGVSHPAKPSINLRKDSNLSFLSRMHIPKSILGTPIVRLGLLLTHEVGTGHSDWHHHLDHWEWGGGPEMMLSRQKLQFHRAPQAFSPPGEVTGPREISTLQESSSP